MYRKPLDMIEEMQNQKSLFLKVQNTIWVDYISSWNGWAEFIFMLIEQFEWETFSTFGWSVHMAANDIISLQVFIEWME